MREKRVVVTIHGIQTDGEWQEEVKRILSPYFHCESIKYTEFRHWGAVKVALELIAIVWSLVCAIGFWYMGPTHELLEWLIALAVVCGFWLTARWKAHRLRKEALETVKVELDKWRTKPPPHLIAHSMGTYLVGTALRTFDDLYYGTVILTGCVLSRAFPWHSRPVAKRFTCVRNEIACKDLVTRIVFFLQGLVPGMGSAGWTGFPNGDGATHFLADPWSRCQCGDSVHNVKHRNLTHSDYFIGRGHAEEFWLAFLWDLGPRDFREFVELCVNVSRSSDVAKEYQRYRSELFDRRWEWASGTLESAIMEEAEARAQVEGIPLSEENRRAIIVLAQDGVWKAVAKADVARNLEGSENEVAALALEPKRAVGLAVNAAMNLLRGRVPSQYDLSTV